MKKKRLKHIHIYIGTIVFSVLHACSMSSSKNTNTIDDAKEKNVIVFAGVGLADVLEEIAYLFEIKHHVQVKLNLASSGTLARQIKSGATADVYISASKKWADYADSLGITKKGYRSVIAQNQLVLVAPITKGPFNITIDSNCNIHALLKSERLSIGDPAHVPAGEYAKQALTYYGWFTQIGKQFLFAKDVRSALMVVEMEEAPLGIVYRTDALKSKKVKIIDTFPEVSHKPIVFTASVCSSNTYAYKFYEYLLSEEASHIFAKYGFKKPFQNKTTKLI